MENNEIQFNKDNITKERIQGLVDIMAAEVENGDKDALEIFILIKAMNEISKKALAALSSYALDEADNHGQKTFNFHGVEVTIKEGATRYKFDHIPDYVAAKAELKKIEERHKAALKNSELQITGVENLTGEIITPAIAVPSARGLSIRFPKY